MAEKFKIAVVGAGPAGMSAAARAAQLGIPHVLIEAAPNVADTVRRYPRGKLVMAEPGQLPLRSALGFAAGPREAVLETWRQALAGLGVNLKAAATVATKWCRI